jgi:cyclopropane fatty-acyl-phospholipid synthase-like methyltransferase
MSKFFQALRVKSILLDMPSSTAGKHYTFDALLAILAIEHQAVERLEKYLDNYTASIKND